MFSTLLTKSSSLVQGKYPWMLSETKLKEDPNNTIDTTPPQLGENNDATTTSMTLMVDTFSKADYRGFLFVLHPDHGLLLLHCTRKKKKPPHYQLPGGHVDREEFEQAVTAMNGDDAAPSHRHPERVLYLAGRAGAARELFEETGMNFISQLDRILPVPLRSSKDDQKNTKEEENDKGEETTTPSKTPKLPNEYKDRLFYVVSVSDEDFYQPKEGDTTKVVRAHGDYGTDKLLKLSVEHSGFRFEPNPDKAIELLEHHSGGKVSEALRRAQVFEG